MRIRNILLCALALLVLALPATAQGDKLVLIDEDGVYLEVTSVEMKDDKLRYNVIVENDSGCEINIRFNEAYADGVEVDGVGIFGVEDGERIDDEFFFFQPLEGDGMEVLEGAQDLSFTIEVKDDDTRDTLLTVPVSLRIDAVSAPVSTPDFPTDARPTPAFPTDAQPEILLVLPDGGYGEWEYADGNMLRMRVTVENTSPARAVEAFEIYMYATNAWDEPIYGENYVYYETTETLVEPFETAFSEYVTMPRADEISRVYAGIHRVRYDNGDIVEADPVVYSYWDIK